MNSLVQAFLMAGARSVVATIWPADDTFTCAANAQVLRESSAGHDKAEALTSHRELLRIERTERPSVLLGRLPPRGRCTRNVSGE